MTPPLAISHVVMLANPCERKASRDQISATLRNHHLEALDHKATHSGHTFGTAHVRVEQHSQFVCWTFTRAIEADAHGGALAQFTQPAISAATTLLNARLDGLPGQRLVGANF